MLNVLSGLFAEARSAAGGACASLKEEESLLLEGKAQGVKIEGDSYRRGEENGCLGSSW